MDKFWKCLRPVACSTVKETKEEREDIFNVFFDYLVAELSSLEQLPFVPWDDHMEEKIHSCESDISFLRMFVWFFSNLDTETISRIHIRQYMRGIPYTKHDIESRLLNLQGMIQNCKGNFEEQCELVLRYSLRCNPLNNSCCTMEEYISAILHNLNDLDKFKTDDEIRLLNNQITVLKEKVILLHNLFNPLIPNQWVDFNEMRAFNVAVHVFAQFAASLVFLYWVKAVDEDMATKLNLLLVNVMHMYKPCVPAFKAVYITFFEEMKSRRLDSLLGGQIVQSFLDLLLENLIANISKEDFQIIQETLFFVISFLVNPPDQHVEDQELMTLTAEMDLLVKQDLYQVLSVDSKNSDFSEAYASFLGDFKRKAELVKGKIQLVYEQTRDSFSYDFPKVNGIRFFDFSLQNLSFLKEKLIRDNDFIPFAKHLIIQIEEELTSFRPYLDDLFERQKEDKELKDTWLNVIDLAYQSEYAINSCLVTGNPLWYNMARLMEVLDRLKDVNSNLKNIEGRKPHDGAILRCSSVAPIRVSEGPSASSFKEVMVGLEEEADKIVENLIYGSKSLDIVAIVGMPGIGKTTMANKVYNAPAVRNYFHVFAYCIVSQVYSTRNLLLDILGDIRGKDDNMHEMTTEDLADKLRKSLLGKRYLIIMDDIWDVKSWDEIARSLPNNQNGSRVIFTTRNRHVALQAKEDCILHELPFLSHKESWELLQKKAFQAEGCPPDFLEVAKMIANKCKGLPLTIGLIAGLLRTERSLSWWNKISEAVNSHVLTEDVMSVLELSYQHLPEHLKPCFLYFGLFEEDKLIRVNKLMLLWIAEGFVLNSKRESLKNVGKDYLSDLVDRSLVIVDKGSSYGGIKSCRIHDLVHEFCQKKAQEENFFELMVNTMAFNSSSSTLRNPYRVCIHMKEKYVGDDTNICPSIRTYVFKSMWEFRHCSEHRCHLRNLKLVQVMDLEGLHCDKYLMREMESLVHLRFMSISFSDFFLDDVISNHWNLEILIVSGVHQGDLPEAFWKMIRLRHVHVDTCHLRIFQGVEIREAHPHPQLVNLESFSSLQVFENSASVAPCFGVYVFQNWTLLVDLSR